MAGETSHRPFLNAGGRKWALISGMSLFLLAAVFLTYIVSSAEPAEQVGQTDGQWLIETVDNSGGWMNGTSIAVDDNDFPRISYSLGKLMYAYKDDSGWHATTLKDFGQEPSLVLDDMG